MELNYALGVIEAMAQHADEGPPSDEECRAINVVVAHVREAERIRAAGDAALEQLENIAGQQLTSEMSQDMRKLSEGCYEDAYNHIVEACRTAVRNLQAARGA